MSYQTLAENRERTWSHLQTRFDRGWNHRASYSKTKMSLRPHPQKREFIAGYWEGATLEPGIPIFLLKNREPFGAPLGFCPASLASVALVFLFPGFDLASMCFGCHMDLRLPNEASTRVGRPERSVAHDRRRRRRSGPSASMGPRRWQKLAELPHMAFPSAFG